MDPKNRSPSFLAVKNAKPASEKKKSPISQKMLFKPVPSIQLLQSLNMYSPIDKSSTTKKITMKPVRTTEINFDEFTKSPIVKTRNVRKQLWSVEKTDSKTRKGTLMKAGKGTLRNSIYTRPSGQTKKLITNKQSIDDTIPLVDMEQFTITKIKRSLFSAPQPKLSFKYGTQRKTSSHINVTKPPIVTTSLAKKIVKPVPPSIVITPVDKINAKKSPVKTMNSSGNTKKYGKVDETIDMMFTKLSVIEEKIDTFDEIKTVLNSICSHLGINTPFVQKTNETQQKCNSKTTPHVTHKKSATKKEKDSCSQTSPIQLKKLEKNKQKKSPIKNCGTSLPTINEKIITESKETCTSSIKSNIHEKKLSSTSKETRNNQQKIDSEKIRPKSNDASKSESAQILQTSHSSPCTPKITKPKFAKTSPKSGKVPQKSSSKPSTPKTDPVNNKTESTVKLKKTWITQFEQLEKKLLNDSNGSINLISSPDYSPATSLKIDKILIKDDNKNETNLTTQKSLSTSSLEASVSSQNKNLFKSKETDLLTESIYVYNELRAELPKFLSTPINRGNKSMDFMTPSVQGNQKKYISRLVQEQFFRLNDS